MLKKFSIRNKLIISILVACLVPYSAGGLYIKHKAESWLYNRNIKNSNMMLNQIAEHVDDSILSSMDSIVAMICMDERIKNVDSSVNSYVKYNPSTFKYKISKSENEIMSYFRSIKSSHSFINMVSYGTGDGGYIEYPPFSPKEPYDPRTRGWYVNAIREKDAVISEPYITKVTKDMVISIDKSVILKNKKIGVVSLTIKLDDLMNHINTLKYGETGYINILTPNNVFINSPENKDWILHSVDELKLDVFKSIDKFNNKSFEAKIGGEDKVLSIHYSPYSGWKYISVIDKKEVLAQSKVLITLLIAIYLITFFVILAIILLISNRITKPILGIAQDINKMAAFNFDIDRSQSFEAYTHYNDEIGEISRALNSMQKNFIELKNNIAAIDEEIQNINLDEGAVHQLELSKDNPFAGITNTINGLLERVHSSIEQIRDYNNEISYKNELLEASKEELTVRLSEIDSQNEFIRFIAEHDSLTNLPNRRKFYERIDQVLLKGGRGAVILLDIDNFKGINDTLGHLFGDKVLLFISKKLEEISSEAVFVSRFGGDEFLLLYEEKENENGIIKFVEQLYAMFGDKFLIDENYVEIEFSVGISLFPRDSSNIDQLIMDADIALYFVKNSGKNRYAFYNSSMLDHLKFKVDTRNTLREAMVNDGLRMVYQPQVDISTGEVIGFEALVRLKDNTSLSPSEFISVAEEDGMIITLGRIITRIVIEQMHSWKNMGLNLKPVAINFSAVQIHDYTYKTYLLDLLDRYGIDPSLIVIEITETSFLINKDATIGLLNELRSHGVKIAIDDFGTGYSSLSYLTFLPINTIKLDRTLCIKFLELENIGVMDSLIALAHSLNMKVIAEGIEEHEQVKRLKVGKCDAVQGYYFSRPMEVDEVEKKYSRVYKV